MRIKEKIILGISFQENLQPNKMNKAIKYLAGLALPLAFAMPANTQEFKLEKLNVKNLESFFSSENAPKIPEAKPSLEKSYSNNGPQESIYNIGLCPRDVSEQDKFRLRYQVYNGRWKKAVFYILDKYPGMQYDAHVQPPMEGGFTIKMSPEPTDDSYFDPAEPVKYYALKINDPSQTIRRSYEITASDLHEENGKKNCLDVVVSIRDEPATKIMDVNKSKIQKGKYDFDVCPKEVKDLGPFRLNYQRFNKQFQRPYFDMDSVYPNNEINNSGGFSIITATNTVHTDVDELNKYYLENTNSAKTIKRKYNLLINRMDEKNCLGMTIAYEEDKRTSFGDFLPRP